MSDKKQNWTQRAIELDKKAEKERIDKQHQEKRQQQKAEFIAKINDFENVFYADIFLLCLSLIATFVIFNRFMFITIGVIRIPRLILHMCYSYSFIKKPEHK